jgi:hypothetical protein
MKEHLKKNVTTVPPAATPVCDSEPGLSVRQWLFTGVLMVLLCVSIPRLWQTLEAFKPGRDYRMPYTLSDDYWHYQRYCQWSVDQHDVMVIGDSVVWGHYVPPDGSLSHYLNQMPGTRTFANLGIDGIHPAAMAGLLKYYGRAITGKTVILSFNPLWMTSKKHDLQTDKEFRFNHPRLVPQFTPKIACYTESIPNRAGIVVERHIPLLSWASHLRTAYFSKMDLSHWALAHPYEWPVRGIPFELPKPQATPEQEDAWHVRGATQQDFPWVSLETSVQWTFFKRAIKTLQDRGNTVFVLMGPFNEHMMTEKSLEKYHAIKAGVETWLQENKVPYSVPAPLPSELYADASHPLRGGYAMLAERLADDESVQAVVLSPAEPAQ